MIPQEQTGLRYYYKDMDVLRFYAAFVVLVEHWFEYLELIPPHLSKYGVFLFFTISGFLITSILISYREKYGKAKYFGIFYLRRIFRIVPIYYLYLTFFVILGQLGFYYCRDVNFLPFYLYLSNFHLIKHSMYALVLNHTWSLAVEEQFYLLWPLVLLLIPKSREIVVMVVILIVLIILKVTVFQQIQPPYLNPFYNFDFIIVGAIIAFKQKELSLFVSRLGQWPWYFVSLFLILLVLDLVPAFVPLNQTYLIICFLLVQLSISGFGSSWIARIMANNLFAYIGKLSYGVYLYHKAIPYLLQPVLNNYRIDLNPAALFFIYLSITLFISYVSFHTIEKYFNGLKSRITKRVATNPA